MTSIICLLELVHFNHLLFNELVDDVIVDFIVDVVVFKLLLRFWQNVASFSNLSIKQEITCLVQQIYNFPYPSLNELETRLSGK